VDHQLRRTRRVARLPEVGVDALVITRLPNVRYLTGFTGSNGLVLVTAAETVFFTDGRYTEQSRHEVPDLNRVTALHGFVAPMANHCTRLGVSRLGFEAHGVTVDQHRRFGDALEGVELVPLGEEVERLRWAKDPDELELLRRAQAATDLAFDDILERLAVGVTERQIALAIEQLLRRDGADGLAFESIVAFGENAAEPHHSPNHRVLVEGDVITLDFGALVGGYHADMTRTVSFGQPPPELRKIHDVVREAQQAGVDAVRAGVLGRDLDRTVRGAIEDAGYGEAFTHGLGHGVGLEIHEGPRLGREFDDELPAGAVITVEPGIYVPGLGGVRIEDSVEVTDEGCRVLGSSTRELLEL
jgi:Xaa-Pro aminopeptidase